MVRPGIYEAACNQKTPRKNSRKESNISMKKYHQRPTLGVRSGSKRRTPYVAAKKSQEPVRKAEANSKAPTAAARPSVCAMIKEGRCGVEFFLRTLASYSRTIKGGKSRMGCMAKYEAKAVARMKVKLAPWAAFAMAVRMKRLVRAAVERARHVARVKGLKRKLGTMSAHGGWRGRQSGYPAATAALLHLRVLRGETNRRVVEAKLECAI
jgi:hypothetical protein